MTTRLTKSTGCRQRNRGKATSAAGAKSDAPPTRATALARSWAAAWSTAARMPAAPAHTSSAADTMARRASSNATPDAAVDAATTAKTIAKTSIVLGAQAAFAGPQHSRRAVGHLELGEDRGQVVAHRLG